jgi:nucleoside-diphosphate-sugar epimerase
MFIKDNKFLVTGANGFLGRAVTTLLQTAEACLKATDLGAESVTPNITYQKADITKLKELKSVLENATIVIHIAGLAHIFSPDLNSVEKFQQINEIGTANIAYTAAAVGVRHLLLIGSVSVYGPYTQGLYDENTPCNPIGPYALSKYNAELRAIEIARESGMALTILRLATLFGEGDPGNVGRLIRMLDNGHFLWIGDGSNRKSLLYKGDAARACLAVAGRPASGINIYNVSAPSCSMHEIVTGIMAALGRQLFPVHIPTSLALFLSRQMSRIPNRHMTNLYPTIKKWLAEDVYDTRRFENAYDFQTKTSLEEGLKREVDWYRNNKIAN